MSGGVLAGFLGARALPDQHLAEDSKDIVNLVSGLIATLSALVLGLLIASAKDTFDQISDAGRHSAAKVILLDRVLSQYGTAADEARNVLRGTYEARVRLMFPEDGVQVGNASADTSTAAIERVEHAVRMLAPQSDTERGLQSHALSITADLVQTRWLALEQSGSSIPTAFLVVLTFWLSVMFASFALFAPRNVTSVVALFLGALSVSMSIFLVEELSHPLDGFISVSSEPMRSVVGQLGN